MCSLNIFQHKQLRDLINSVKRYVIFHPLKEFKLWIKDVDKQKKKLSKLCSFLFSFQLVDDLARAQWAVDINIEISRSTWEKRCFFN